MIEIRGLSKWYDQFLAVNDLSFTVKKGDIFGFIGPNGAGKTTTMKVLATLLEPSAGNAFVAGHSVVDDPEKVRHVLGYMPDYYGVYEGLTVWEYLDFFASAYAIPRRRRARILEDVMELTDLTGLRTRMASDLSKGMTQRLCLAKTLIHDPQVLILDEPASGLDPRARIELRILLRELGEMGKTILISSHILTELADMCNAVAILERGTLIASGGVDEILRRTMPFTTMVLRVRAEVERAKEVLGRFPFVQRMEAREREISFQFQGEQDIPALVKQLALSDVPIVGLEEQKADLEDVFMKITKGEVA